MFAQDLSYGNFNGCIAHNSIKMPALCSKVKTVE